MEFSKVYFTGLRATAQQNLLDKLELLIKKAGILTIDLKKKFTALKIHFGEPGNLAYIRPNYAARIAKVLQSQGAYVYLTDANTLYKGRRSNAVDHLQSALENGFNAFSAGCNVIIADGVKGTDYREIEIHGKNCKTAKIGSAIADADVIISLTHVKGHELTGLGGCLKNLGMGSASIGGKLELHSSSKPKIQREKCTSCGLCVKNCAHDAVKLDAERKAVINYDKCVGCGQCVAVCLYDSAIPEWDGKDVHEKIAEYTQAVIKDKVHFHVSFLMNISPNCDCWNTNDQPIAPDIGILASFDPVAIDRAAVDLINQAMPIKSSCIGDQIKEGEKHDKFTLAQPHTDWRIGLDYAEKIGLGSQKYELVKVGD